MSVASKEARPKNRGIESMTKYLIQAYRQTPWRVQAQRLIGFAALLICAALVAVVYLNLAGQTANAGLEFQRLDKTQRDLERQIADLHTQLALITSEAKMMERAKALGFVPMAMDKAMYIVVPGYTGRTPVIVEPLMLPAVVSEPILKPSYTQSLWEWLFQGALGGTSAQTGGQIQ
jgi:cell division protein FtsB